MRQSDQIFIFWNNLYNPGAGWTHAGNPEAFSVWHRSHLTQVHKCLGKSAERRRRQVRGQGREGEREGRRQHGRAREKRTGAKVLTHRGSCFSKQDH